MVQEGHLRIRSAAHMRADRRGAGRAKTVGGERNAGRADAVPKGALPHSFTLTAASSPIPPMLRGPTLRLGAYCRLTVSVHRLFHV